MRDGLLSVSISENNSDMELEVQIATITFVNVDCVNRIEPTQHRPTSIILRMNEPKSIDALHYSATLCSLHTTNSKQEGNQHRLTSKVLLHELL